MQGPLAADVVFTGLLFDGLKEHPPPDGSIVLQFHTSTRAISATLTHLLCGRGRCERRSAPGVETAQTTAGPLILTFCYNSVPTVAKATQTLSLSTESIGSNHHM